MPFGGSLYTGRRDIEAEDKIYAKAGRRILDGGGYIPTRGTLQSIGHITIGSRVQK